VDVKSLRIIGNPATKTTLCLNPLNYKLSKQKNHNFTNVLGIMPTFKQIANTIIPYSVDSASNNPIGSSFTIFSLSRHKNFSSFSSSYSSVISLVVPFSFTAFVMPCE